MVGRGWGAAADRLRVSVGSLPRGCRGAGRRGAGLPRGSAGWALLRCVEG